ncbi:MAG: TIGR03013 family XrtA/PEP-CTERM system glycosyltransferase [Vicinamibacterales bacterium]
MQLFNRHVSGRGLTVFGFETVLITGAILVAAQWHGAFETAVGGIWRVVLITGLCELCFYYNDLYDLTIVHSKSELAVRILQGAGAAAIVLAIVSTLAPSTVLGNGTALTALGLLLVAVPAWRLAFDGVTRDPHMEERVLILGTGPTARSVATLIAAQYDFGYRVVGFVEDGSTRGTAGDGEGFGPAADAQVGRDDATGDSLGRAGDLPTLIRTHQVDRIVVSLGDRRGRMPIHELLQAKLSGVRVEDAATTYERLTGKILIDEIKPSWLIFSDGFRASRLTRAIKRVLDLVLAAVGVFAAAPLMLLTAFAVRLESPGPVLYRQERVGEAGRIFTLCKFRSMRADAENGTPIWATDGDQRVTRVGRFIRATRLDELPQLWNVLRGDMSFVGPRPERPFFVEQLAASIPFYMERHAVKPGLTGWAQVKYRYGSSVEDAMEKLRYDLYYIKHLSIVFDLTIVMDTVKVILSGKGAK